MRSGNASGGSPAKDYPGFLGLQAQVERIIRTDYLRDCPTRHLDGRLRPDELAAHCFDEIEQTHQQVPADPLSVSIP